MDEEDSQMAKTFSVGHLGDKIIIPDEANDINRCFYVQFNSPISVRNLMQALEDADLPLVQIQACSKGLFWKDDGDS